MLCVAVLLAGSAGAAAPGDPAAAPPSARRASGGRALVAAAEGAQSTLLGRVGEVRRLDAHGFAAPLAVERVLAGALAPGAATTVAWEELAPSRPVRFAAGDRVVVALGPLPTGSLWTGRFPRRDALAVAARGDGFLVDPDPVTLDRLAAWLAVPAGERNAGPGVTALAGLVAEADPRVAASALARLGEVPGLGDAIGPGAAALLSGVVSGAKGRPVELRRALLGLVAARRIHALRAAAEKAAAGPGPLEAAALEALAALDGGLPAERVAACLARPEGELRAVAVRHGGAAVDRERLAELARSDPAPIVRVAAVELLVSRHGATVLDLAAPVLVDADPAVRAAAARSIGALGTPAVPGLRGLAERSRGGDAAGPIAALWEAGPEGQAVVRMLAESHPDEQVRRLCRLLVGGGETH
jgi:hypothetical protein